MSKTTQEHNFFKGKVSLSDEDLAKIHIQEKKMLGLSLLSYKKKRLGWDNISASQNQKFIKWKIGKKNLSL